MIYAFGSAAACWDQTAVAIAAHSESPGIAIADDFIGLSFETGSLATATGFPAAYRQALGMVESPPPSGSPAEGLAGVIATMTDATGPRGL